MHAPHLCIALDTLPILLHTVRGHPGHLHTQLGDDGPESTISTTIHWTTSNLQQNMYMYKEWQILRISESMYF